MDNLISRAKAIEAFEKFIHEIGIEDAPYNYGEIALCEANVPTEEKVGKWIKNADENCWWYECSECGDYPMKNAWGHEELSAYCPHCGARMEGDGEEDEILER